MYNGKEYGNGMAYICERLPDCRGSVSTDPQGKPLGFIVDPETKQLRMWLHDTVDKIWQDLITQGVPRNKARGKVYGWLKRIMELEPKDCHIAMFSREQCLLAIERIK